MNYKCIENINLRIRKEVCYDIINSLKDENMLEIYKQMPSVKKQIEILCKVLQQNKISTEKISAIISQYLPNLIPAGTKGVKRGLLFNKLVEDEIRNMKLDNKRFIICFEKQCDWHKVEETPDWYILERKSKKIIIGMNQLDLIGGGQQINRGFKYIIDNKHNTKNSKLLCVICNMTEIKSTKTKAYELFKVGFSNNTLCYITNLRNIIIQWFH
ncbi:MAG: hypothetical protein ACYCPT_07030 [Acidimicrobiales bacterium]